MHSTNCFMTDNIRICPIVTCLLYMKISSVQIELHSFIYVTLSRCCAGLRCLSAQRQPPLPTPTPPRAVPPPHYYTPRRHRRPAVPPHPSRILPWDGQIRGKLCRICCLLVGRARRRRSPPSPHLRGQRR